MQRQNRKRISPGLVVVKEHCETGPATKRYKPYRVISVHPTGFYVQADDDRPAEHIDWDRKGGWRILTKTNVLRRIFS